MKCRNRSVNPPAPCSTFLVLWYCVAFWASTHDKGRKMNWTNEPGFLMNQKNESGFLMNQKNEPGFLMNQKNEPGFY
jgi:hypothetical protein